MDTRGERGDGRSRKNPRVNYKWSMRERGGWGGERDKQTDRQTDKEKQRQRETARDRERSRSRTRSRTRSRKRLMLDTIVVLNRTTSTMTDDGVAQWVERRTWDPKDEGTNPGWSTRKMWVFPSQKCSADSLSVCPTPVCVHARTRMINYAHAR